MQALETYPSFNRKNVSEEEFAHVKNSLIGRTCGTLSKSEWEASCKSETIVLSWKHSQYFFFAFSALYLVFAFQKMKKQYNEKGEAEYIEV